MFNLLYGWVKFKFLSICVYILLWLLSDENYYIIIYKFGRYHDDHCLNIIPATSHQYLHLIAATLELAKWILCCRLIVLTRKNWWQKTHARIKWQSFTLDVSYCNPQIIGEHFMTMSLFYVIQNIRAVLTTYWLKMISCYSDFEFLVIYVPKLSLVISIFL